MNFHAESIQIWELTLASLKSRYRKTWAGFLWVILNPILMFGVQSLVFRHILRIDIPDYLLFLIGGLLPWIFFSTTVQMGTPIFVSQGQLLRSFKINPWILLAAQVLDSFINFLASFLLLLIPFFILSEKSLTLLFFLPIAFIPLFIGTLSITITLSILNIFYRDINFVMGFIFSLLFFLTPIFYPKEFIPPNYEWIIQINPVIYFIDPFRLIIYNHDLFLFSIAIVKGLLLAIVFSLTALWVWKRKRNEFYRIL